MSEPEQRTKKILHFGGFTLNLERRGLYRGQERVHLTSKPLETLIFLVENRTQVVEKQTLLDTVWKGTFVTEDVLVQSVREIRRVLGDDKDNPLFIQTVPRQGYRFVGEVSAEPTAVSPPAMTTAHQETQAFGTGSVPVVDAPAERVRPARRRRLLLLSGLVGLALVVLFVSQTQLLDQVVSWFRPERPEAKIRTQTLIITGTGNFSAGKPALSADGKNLLFISSNEKTQEKGADGKVKTFGDLFVRELATGSETQITFQENPSGDIPVFSADGSHVVFSNYRHTETGTSLPDLYSLLSGGGTAAGKGRLFIREASGAGFSPDGQWVAYTKHLPSQKALWLSPAEHPEKAHREIAPNGFTPRWSWDGKLIAYTTSNPNGGLGDLWIVDAQTLTGERNLTNEPQQMYGLTWTPDGRSLIFASKKTGPCLLWRVLVAGGNVEPVADLTGDFAAPSMSRVSNMLVFSHYHGAQNLMLAPEPKAEARELSNDEYHKWSRLSPSGRYVASVMEQPDLGKHLYVTDLDGHHTRLSELPAHHPCWAGEGKIAYLHWDQGTRQTEVLVVDITNLNRPETKRLDMFPGPAEWLAIDPQSGSKLAAVLTLADGSRQIVMHDPDRRTTQVITSGSEYANLRWSPDGSTLAWSGPEESGHESNGIWLIKPGAESPPSRIVENGYGPVWKADGSTIYFSRIDKESGLWAVDLNTKNYISLRPWREVPFFDVVGERLIYCQLGSSGKNRIYSLTVD
jgi:Tol biopolymer transport system component/DNA-binding winged helix-turn-helix (wHTH) protein